MYLLDDLREGADAASNSQLREQLRKADIAHLHKVSDSGHAQGAGQISLSRAGRAHEDDVVGPLMYAQGGSRAIMVLPRQRSA